MDRDPQPGDERGRAGGPDHGSHGGGVPGVETPGGGGGDGAQAGPWCLRKGNGDPGSSASINGFTNLTGEPLCRTRRSPVMEV